jgi:UDP-GlcNAc:undecaprenyl-phosphate GlcNAc-1-phosphate transferase
MALLPALTAFLIAAAFTPLVRAAAVRWGVVDHPLPRKIHRQPVPLLGGVAVVVAFGITAIAFAGTGAKVIGVVVGAVLFLAIGLLDDLRDHGGSKLAIEFAVAWFLVMITGERFHVPLPGIGTLFTVLWVVGVANAFNCLDCADGVAVAVGATAAAAFGAVAALTQQWVPAVMAAGLMGGLLGFLPFNLHPVKTFLGNAGSLSVGYLVAALGVIVSPGVLSVPAMAIPIVVLAIPIVDFLLVHYRRYQQGTRNLKKLLTSTGKDHLPHRLLGRGFSTSKMGTVMLLGSVCTGAAGFTLAAANTVVGAIATSMLVVAVLIVLDREWVGHTPTKRTLAAQSWQPPDSMRGPE